MLTVMEDLLNDMHLNYELTIYKFFYKIILIKNKIKYNIIGY